jgi:hypothetical protein
METKICKDCSEAIKAEAKKCPKCQVYQNSFDRFIRSPIGGSMVGIVIGLGFFVWFTNSFMFQDDSIYNPEKLLQVSDTSFQFKEVDCGFKVTLIGTITNKSDGPLRNVVFDIEYLDSDGNTIDVINDEVYDLIIPANSSKKFKVSGTAGAKQELYATSKATISKVEPDGWP